MDKTLATFRVDSDIWEAFRQKTSANGMTATSAILAFIKRYLADGSDVCIDDTSSRIDSYIDNCIDVRLQQFEAQILGKF